MKGFGECLKHSLFCFSERTVFIMLKDAANQILKEAQLNGFEVQILHDPAHYVEIDLDMASEDPHSSLSNTDNWNWQGKDFNSEDIRYHVVGIIQGKVLSKNNLKEDEVYPVLKEWNKQQAIFRERVRSTAEFLLDVFKLDYGHSDVSWDDSAYYSELYTLNITAEAPHGSHISFHIDFKDLFLKSSYKEVIKAIVAALDNACLKATVRDVCDQVHTMAEMSQTNLDPTNPDEYSKNLQEYAEDCDFFTDKYYEVSDAYINEEKTLNIRKEEI